MSPEDGILALLTAANLVLYGSAAYALRPRLRRGERAGDISGAFAALAMALQTAIPDIPPGFTWNEAVERTRKMELDVDWDKVSLALRSYEAQRYGGDGSVAPDYGEVLVLAKELRRRG